MHASHSYRSTGALPEKAADMHRQFTASDCNQKAADMHRRIFSKRLQSQTGASESATVRSCVCPHVETCLDICTREGTKERKLIGQLGCRTRQYVTRPCTRTRCARGYTVHLCRNSLFTPSPRKSNHGLLDVNRNRNCSRMVLVPALALVAHATIQCPSAGTQCSRPHRGSRTTGCWT